MDEEIGVSADEELVRVLHVVDDGRDWSGWIVWDMNNRRLSEKRFERPPARPQIVPPSIKPKNKRRKKRRKVMEVV